MALSADAFGTDAISFDVDVIKSFLAINSSVESDGILPKLLVCSKQIPRYCICERRLSQSVSTPL